MNIKTSSEFGNWEAKHPAQAPGMALNASANGAAISAASSKEKIRLIEQLSE